MVPGQGLNPCAGSSALIRNSNAWPEGTVRPPSGAAHGLTGCDTQLLTHKIGTRDLLGHRMFHLDAGIHLHKVEAAILIEEKLDGTGIRRSQPHAQR